jgi:probable HAF family extracellular repeat protein
MTSLGTLGGDWSTAWDINDHGQIVGYSSVEQGKSRAFYWDSENGMIELPTFGGNSLARSINNKGEIVGYSYDAEGHFYPVLWTIR